MNLKRLEDSTVNESNTRLWNLAGVGYVDFKALMHG